MTDATGRQVVQIEALSIANGQRLRLTFESHRSNWRQGVWLGTQGKLRVNNVQAPQIVLWQDTAPQVLDVEVIATDGLLRFYNVWDSGRGRANHESNSATSGMLVESAGQDSYRYRCHDIGFDPDFDKLVFTITSNPGKEARADQA